MKDPARATGSFGLAVLRGLQGKHMYAGTVPAAEVERRRTRNRAARRTRRVNRQRGAR